MSIPSFSEWPDIPQRSAPEADFDAKMYALFQHFATTHRNEMLAFINFLENNSTVINGALNGTTIGLNTPAAGKFTTLLADSLGGAAVQSNATDTTVGRLLKMASGNAGAFGLGATSGTPVLADLNNHGTPAGIYGVSSSTVGTRPPNSSAYAHLVVLRQANTGICQLFISSAEKDVAIRTATNGVWGPWMVFFSRHNMLGVVSHSGGVPTGAVIERGSNANGEYVRFADGTQICWQSLTLGAPNTALGSVFTSDSSTVWNFPAPFAPGTIPVMAGTEGNVGGYTKVVTFCAGATFSAVSAERPTSSGATPNVVATAIGRWF